MTPLVCAGCGKRCGSAELLADGDLIHVTTYNVVRRGQSCLPLHVTRGQTLRLSDPEGWPLTWRCEVCQTATVELTRGQARRAGHVKRLILATLASDT